MDNLKKYLAVLNKYQFWIICVVVLITAAVSWLLATASLATQFTKRESKLKTAFRSVVVQPEHPNQGVIDKINQQHNALKRNVYEAWKVLYDEQKAKNPLPPELGEDFKRAFENLKPKEDLQYQYLQTYQNYIKRHLATLKSIIDAFRSSEQSEARAAGDAGKGGAKEATAPAGGKPEPTGTVEWNESDYRALESKFDWGRNIPSTLAVVLAQENLWVYKALLRVINRTNEGATGHATAAVKRIEALEIGQDAVKAWKDAEEAIFKGGKTGRETKSSGKSEKVSDQERMQRQLMEDRYVDDKGNPLAYEAEFPYARHPYAEFKMMPIRMSLVMDQRRLPKLLVECANSSMPIEVRRVRITKTAGSSTLSTRTTSKETAKGAAAASDKSETGSLDIPVEIHGVIYIYNPPDREKLGTGAASAEKPAEPSAAASPPADAPPATAPAGSPATPPTP